MKHWDAQSPEEPGQMKSSDEFIIFMVQDTTKGNHYILNPIHEKHDLKRVIVTMRWTKDIAFS